MNESEATNAQLNSALVSIQSNLTQLKPLLVELKMRFSDLKNAQPTYSKGLIVPCNTVMQTIVEIFRPIEMIYRNSNTKINIDSTFNSLISETVQLIGSSVLNSEIFFPFTASFLPLLCFYFQCKAPKEVESGESFNTLFFTFHKFITTKVPKIFNFDIQDLLNSLKSFGETVKKDEQLAKLDPLVENIISKIDLLKEKFEQSVKQQIDNAIITFRAEVITYLPIIYKSQDLKMSYQEFTTNLKNIEQTLLIESRISKIKVLSNEINDCIEKSPDLIQYQDFSLQKLDLTKFLAIIAKHLIQINEFSSLSEELKNFISNQSGDFSNLMKSISEIKIPVELPLEISQPAAAFEFGFDQEDSIFKKLSVSYIADRLPKLYELVKAQEQPEIFISILSSIRKIRSVTKICKENDGFIALYEYLIYILLLPQSKPFYNNLITLLASYLPSRACIANIFKLADLEQQANDIIILINKSDSSQQIRQKLLQEDVIEQSDAATISVDLERPVDALHALDINLRHAADFMEFIELHSNLLQKLGVEGVETLCENPDPQFANITSLTISILQSPVNAKVTEQFLSSWIKLIGKAMTCGAAFDDINEFAKLIPFIDYSQMLMESALKCNNITAITQQISNNLGNDIYGNSLHSSALSLQVKFFDMMMTCRTTDINQSLSNVFNFVKKTAYEWYPEISRLGRSLISVAGVISHLDSLTQALIAAGCKDLELMPLIRANMALGILSSASIINEIIENEKIKKFADAEFVFETLYNCSNEIVDKYLGDASVSIVNGNDIVDPQSLYEATTRFLYTMAGYASSPTLKNADDVIKVLKDLSQTATLIDEGLRTGKPSAIFYFQSCLRKVDFTKLKLSTCVDKDLAAFKLALAAASESALIASIAVLASLSFDALPYNSEPFIPYEDIAEIPKTLSQVTSYLKTQPKIYSTQTLLDKLKAIIEKHSKKQTNPETEKIVAETEEMVGELSKLVKQYNDLIGDGVKLPAPPADGFQQLDKLQVESSIMFIEAELIRSEVKALEKDVSRMKLILERYSGSGERAPQVEAVKRILREVTRPKLALPDDSAELSQMFEKVSAENERLLDELTRIQRGVMSHEDQLDMLLIKSDEIRNVQIHSLGKEETDAIRRQIQETTSSIQYLRRKHEKGVFGNENAQLKNFIRHSRELVFNESKPNVSAQRKFFEVTIESAERMMKQRNELLAKRNALLEKRNSKQ